MSVPNFCCFAVLLWWHVKDPGHSAKSAGGRSHLNTHVPWTQRSRSGLTVQQSRHSVGTNPETSSRATCQGTFGHSRLSSLSHCGLILDYGGGISVRELISTLKKNCRRGMNSRTFSKNLRKRGKSNQRSMHQTCYNRWFANLILGVC